jgi:hypothetical protein
MEIQLWLVALFIKNNGVVTIFAALPTKTVE